MLEEELPLEEKPVEDVLAASVPFAKRTAIRTMLKANGFGVTFSNTVKLATEREMRTSLLALCKVSESEYRAAGGKL
jgi:hypothetical protein